MTMKVDYNRYISAYARVRPKAKEAQARIEKSIRSRILLYFWPNEEPNKIQVYGRVKSPDGFYTKIVSKVADPCNPMQLVQPKTDLVGVRLVVSRRTQIPRAILLVRECDDWDIEGAEAFTDSDEEKSSFEALGLKVKSRDGGYCGIHFDIKLRDPKMVVWAEIQIRTKIQDAWQDIDHSLYKARNELPESFTTMRKLIAQQFETSEKTQNFIFDYIRDEITGENIQLFGSPFYSVTDWSSVLGLPSKYNHKLIRGETLDCYYFLDSELTRWTLVLEDADGSPIVLIDERYLTEHHPAVLQEVVQVTDHFMAALPLNGNISLQVFLGRRSRVRFAAWRQTPFSEKPSEDS